MYHDLRKYDLRLERAVLTEMERLELSWLRRQSEPVWGGHLKRGEPLEGTSLESYVKRGLIEDAGNCGVGYVITAKGRAELRNRK